MLYLAIICQANNAEESDSGPNGVCPKHHSRTVNRLTRTDEPRTQTQSSANEDARFSSAATVTAAETQFDFWESYLKNVEQP